MSMPRWPSQVQADPEADYSLQQPGAHQRGPAAGLLERLQNPAPREAVPVPKQLDPKRMELSDEERQWAVAIKERITSCREIDDLSDIWYAQLAIITGGNVDEAVQRAANLQNLKEDLKIRDDYEQGKQVTQNFTESFPGCLLSLDFHDPEGAYISVWDASKFRGWKAPDKKYATMLCCYYLCHVLNPDLESTRRGSVWFIEAHGFGFNMEMMNVDLFRFLFADVMGSYPMKLRCMKCFHTPMLYNVLISMVKKVIPADFASKFQVGCIFLGKLDEFYTLPTPEIAAQKTFATFVDCLKMRYENEKAFTL
jgi:CRAL/TRIO domain